MTILVSAGSKTVAIRQLNADQAPLVTAIPHVSNTPSKNL